MSPDRKIAWGVTMEDPVDDILLLVKPNAETIIVSLGCGRPEKVIELQWKLRPCTVFGCDIDPLMTGARRMFDDDRASYPFAFFYEDITQPTNLLIQLGVINEQATGRNEGIIQAQAVLANNVLCNLTRTPFDCCAVAFSIAYGLKLGGYVFILDHLLKDCPPFGSLDTQKRYRERYRQAHQAGRPLGDVWTEPPPRFVHHFSQIELSRLFPSCFYSWEKFQTIPYTGDSGSTTNSFYLVLRRLKEVGFDELYQYYLGF